jgi:hypothetical protein
VTKSSPRKSSGPQAFRVRAVEMLHGITDPVEEIGEGEILLVESLAKTLGMSMDDLAKKAELSRTTMWFLKGQVGPEVWRRIWHVLDEEWLLKMKGEIADTPTKKLERWDAAGRSLLAVAPDLFDRLLATMGGYMASVDGLRDVLANIEEKAPSAREATSERPSSRRGRRPKSP